MEPASLERPSLAVVHLIRADGVERFRAFIDSYRAHPAGVDHELVLLFKGLASSGDAAPYLSLAEDLAPRAMFVDDDGFDLTAYAKAGALLESEQLCFLNSHSLILHGGWLANLQRALAPDVGIAGATGSWNSTLSGWRYLRHLPSPYRSVFPDRRWFVAETEAMAAEGAPAAEGPPTRFAEARSAMVRSGETLYCQLAFLPFPACHVRTNAFIVSSRTLRRLRFWPMRRKAQAWRLESGRGGITRQLQAMGLRTLVVGRDGVGYGPREWPGSNTLWQEDQQNLLVADNQTEAYRRGSRDRRELLSRLAWGNEARPTAPEPPA